MPDELNTTAVDLRVAKANGYGQGWQDASHAWQAWLDANLPIWHTLGDLSTLPRMPELLKRAYEQLKS